MGPYASLWVLLCAYRSLCVLMGPWGFQCVLNCFFFVRIGPYASLQVPMGLVRSLLACLHVHFWEPVLSSSA